LIEWGLPKGHLHNWLAALWNSGQSISGNGILAEKVWVLLMISNAQTFTKVCMGSASVRN